MMKNEILNKIKEITNKTIRVVNDYLSNAIDTKYFVRAENGLYENMVYITINNEKYHDSLSITFYDHFRRLDCWQMNVAAMGMFDIFGDNRATDYYKLVAFVMGNKKLESIFRSYRNEVGGLYKEMRDIENKERLARYEAAEAERERSLAERKDSEHNIITNANGVGYVVINKMPTEGDWFIYRNKPVAIATPKVFETERDAEDWLYEGINYHKSYKVIEVSKLKVV